MDDLLQNTKAYCIFDGPFRGVYRKWAIVNQHVMGKNILYKGYSSFEEVDQAFNKIRQQLFEKIESNYFIFSNKWKMLTHYTEEMSKECFFPRNGRTGAKAAFYAGAESKTLYSFFVNGLVSDIYVQQEPFKGVFPELTDFPQKFQKVVEKFNNFCTKGREIFFKVTSLYPLFDEDGKNSFASLSI